MPILRLVLVWALVAATGVAHADTGMLPGGATLSWPRMFIRDANDSLVEPPDPDTFRLRLNLASCVCSKASAGSTDLYYELKIDRTLGQSVVGELWVGTECENDLVRDMQCTKVMDIGDLEPLVTSENNFPVPLFKLINPTMMLQAEGCRQVNEGTGFVWVLADTDADATPDFFSPRPIDLDLFDTAVNGFDTKPPPLVDSLTVSGSEESIEIQWEIPLADQADLFGFHALCMDAAGLPVKPDPGKVLYTTTDTVCDLPQTFDVVATPVSSTDGREVAAPPTAFTTLDSSFICGTVESGTATSLRIEGLTNNEEYTVALVAVDFYGNAVATYFNRTVVPKPVTDLWEDIHDRGSKIEGGFCSTGSPSSWLGVLLVLGVLVVRRRGSHPRRRLSGSWGRRRLGAVAALVVLVALPTAARADDFTPYWEDPDSSGDSESLEREGPRWHAGIRLGPYVPGIDAQVGVNSTTGLGPYRAMFGNYYTRDADGEIVGHDTHVYQVLPMLDVDRFIWTGSGQVAIGGTIGYMQKSAFAYAQEDMNGPDQFFRIRSTAAKNTFRLIPFALTATYRATQLDDLYGIPVVPYVRGGLSYYVWWLKGPNGDVAKVCKDGSMDAGCETNKAYGGSFGVQATLGLAIRAERIDAAAARSMVNSGIDHAGFYVEYMFAKVDGFGSEKKLSVGDNTWFAGIDFEF